MTPSPRLAFAVLAVSLATAAAAQPMTPPRLRVPGAEKPIEVARLDARVVIHGLHAETTQTVTFFNPNARVLEGDLEFPLPDGATVSGFGLDVEGQIVDGVVVSRQKARVVLETEIRRGVDPGIVEQVRGNLHRARVYPIPARGTRTVRLRWVQPLSTRGAEAAYHLPLPYDRPIGEVALRVEIVRAPVQPELSGGFGSLALRPWEDRWIAEGRWTGAAPVRDLVVRLPRLPERLVDVEPGEGREAFFSVSELLPASAAAKAAPPRRIAVAFDASGSRDADATARELAFLGKLLEAWPTTAVDLVVFRDRPERPVAFAAGEGRRLLEALRAAPTDGGTALAALDLRRAALPHADDELWLLLSDGLGTLGEALPAAGDVPVRSATGASVADRALLRHLAARSGGELVDLVTLDAAAGARALAAPGPRLLRAEASPAGAVADLLALVGADRTRAAVAGRLLADEAEVTLVVGAGRAAERRTVRIRRGEASHAGAGAGPIATAWAQAKAEALGLFAGRNEADLLVLGRRFGLVTAGTSLLVLETLAQHLEHGVEPPASRPALRTEYLARSGERSKEKDRRHRDHLEEVVRLWQERIRWWETEFRVESGWRWGAPAKGEAADERDGPRRARRQDQPARLAEEAPASMAMPAAPLAAPPGLVARTAMGGGANGFAAKEKSGRDSAEASIAVKAWDPDVPYLASIKRAAPGAAYAAYLAERDRHAGPAFFLDCAEHFLRAGDKLLGLRILTNLAELRLDDAALLRVLAWRLAQAGQLDLATDLLEKVDRLRPEEPQSKRDLALVLADRAEAAGRPEDAARAVALLWDVVRQRWDRFPEIEVIACMELNRVLARAERRGWGARVRGDGVDARLRRLLDLDLRVSLSWNADLTDVDLHLFEPTGEHASYSHQRTVMGGLVSRDFTQGYGPEEYVARRALPGRYAVKVHYYGSRQQTLVGPATITATVFTNWGRPDEKREVLTLRLDQPADMAEVGLVTVGSGSLR